MPELVSIPVPDPRQQLRQAGAQHEADISAIRRCFVLKDEASVTNFLRDHRTIPQLLMEALPHLEKHFGPHTVFALKATTDEDGSRNLYAVALWTGEAREAMNALDKFEDAWWLANSHPASGSLNFTYELE
jgi:hypothetical protein